MLENTILEVAIVVILAIQGLILMDLATLKQEITATVTVEESVLTLLANLATRLAAYKNEPAAIQELADELVNERQKLAAAITQNTVAELPPVVDQAEADKGSQAAPVAASEGTPPSSEEPPAA